MKNLILIALMFVGSLAFAGTGQGAVSCNDGDGIVAVYSWFHSNADSYAVTTVFVQKDDGTYKQYRTIDEAALEPLVIQTDEGAKIIVTPNLKFSKCSIEVK